MLEKYPYLKGKKLDHTLFEDYPEEASYHYRLAEKLEPPCIETQATMCIAYRKIGVRFPERTFERTEYKTVEYTKESARNLREYSYEAEAETSQYVCSEFQFKKGSKITEADWDNRKTKYHYFRF